MWKNLEEIAERRGVSVAEVLRQAMRSNIPIYRIGEDFNLVASDSHRRWASELATDGEAFISTARGAWGRGPSHFAILDSDLGEAGLTASQDAASDRWCGSATGTAPAPGTIKETPPPRPVPRDGKLIETIAALLAAWPGGASAIPSGKELEKAAQSVGLGTSDDTIRKALDAAYEAAPSLRRLNRQLDPPS